MPPVVGSASNREALDVSNPAYWRHCIGEEGQGQGIGHVRRSAEAVRLLDVFLRLQLDQAFAVEPVLGHGQFLVQHVIIRDLGLFQPVSHPSV